MADGVVAPVLLDTHVWIWLMEGEGSELAPSVRDAIEAASEAGAIRIAAITVWEVAMLAAKGRLRLTMEIDEWIRRALSAPGTQLVELTPEVAIDSTRLPGDAVGDPVDRMLIATARRTGARLVTRDQKMLACGASGYLAVMDATP